MAEKQPDPADDALVIAAQQLAAIASTLPGGPDLARRALDVAFARIGRAG